MRNWLFHKTQNFAKQLVSFAKQRNSFRIEFLETKSETSLLETLFSTVHLLFFCPRILSPARIMFSTENIVLVYVLL
jgi:hypothetical protein